MWRNRFGRGFGPVVCQITDDDDDVFRIKGKDKFIAVNVVKVYRGSRCIAPLSLNLYSRRQFYLKLQITGGHWGVVFRDVACNWQLATGVWSNISQLHPNDMVSIHPDALQCCQWRIYRKADEA